MGSFFNKIKEVADPIGDIVAHVAGPNSFVAKDAPSWAGQINPEMGALQKANVAQFQAPAGTLAAGNYAGKDPSLAAAAAGYATPSTSQPGSAPGSSFNGSPPNLLSMPNPVAAPGGTNFFAAPGAAAAASPQSYVQAAGRTLAQQPGTGQAGTDLNNRGGYY